MATKALTVQNIPAGLTFPTPKNKTEASQGMNAILKANAEDSRKLEAIVTLMKKYLGNTSHMQEELMRGFTRGLKDTIREDFTYAIRKVLEETGKKEQVEAHEYHMGQIELFEELISLSKENVQIARDMMKGVEQDKEFKKKMGSIQREQVAGEYSKQGLKEAGQLWAAEAQSASPLLKLAGMITGSIGGAIKGGQAGGGLKGVARGALGGFHVKSKEDAYKDVNEARAARSATYDRERERAKLTAETRFLEKIGGEHVKGIANALQAAFGSKDEFASLMSNAMAQAVLNMQKISPTGEVPIQPAEATPAQESVVADDLVKSENATEDRTPGLFDNDNKIKKQPRESLYDETEEEVITRKELRPATISRREAHELSQERRAQREKQREIREAVGTNKEDALDTKKLIQPEEDGDTTVLKSLVPMLGTPRKETADVPLGSGKSDKDKVYAILAKAMAMTSKANPTEADLMKLPAPFSAGFIYLADVLRQNQEIDDKTDHDIAEENALGAGGGGGDWVTGLLIPAIAGLTAIIGSRIPEAAKKEEARATALGLDTSSPLGRVSQGLNVFNRVIGLDAYVDWYQKLDKKSLDKGAMQRGFATREAEVATLGVEGQTGALDDRSEAQVVRELGPRPTTAGVDQSTWDARYWKVMGELATDPSIKDRARVAGLVSSTGSFPILNTEGVYQGPIMAGPDNNGILKVTKDKKGIVTYTLSTPEWMKTTWKATGSQQLDLTGITKAGLGELFETLGKKKIWDESIQPGKPGTYKFHSGGIVQNIGSRIDAQAMDLGENEMLATLRRDEQVLSPNESKMYAERISKLSTDANTIEGFSSERLERLLEQLAQLIVQMGGQAIQAVDQNTKSTADRLDKLDKPSAVPAPTVTTRTIKGYN